MKEKIKKIKSFIQTISLLFRKKIKGIFQFKLSGITLPKIKFKQKSFVASLPIILAITAGVAGISYGVVEYKKISGLVREADQFTKEEKYGEAIGKLNLVQVSWFVDNLRIQKEKISSEIEKNEKLDEDKSKYNQGIDELNNGNLEEAINLLSELPESSFYYQKSQTKIEEAKRKIVEEELGETKIAKKEAEEKAQQEAIKRSQAEARAKQEEFEKKLKEQQLSEKEAEEKRMNADNDGDGLTYREELDKGTSDWDSDSDDDGIIDGLDSHPAGGGRLIAQHFEWDYGGKHWTWDYSFHSDWHDYYKNKEHGPHSADYVTYKNTHIKEIADMLTEAANKKGYSKSLFAVAFIQSLGYVPDEIIGYDDFPKYALETFGDQNGDCEDTSYLAAAIVIAMGIDCVLVELPGHLGHMAIAIAFSGSPEGYYYRLSNGWNYYYIETTDEGWWAGEIPKEYKYTRATLVKIPSNQTEEKSPNYIPFTTCFASLDYPGYYYNREGEWYHDSNCTQPVVVGCYKSTSYPGYYRSGTNYYRDSRCLVYTSCLPSLLYSGYYFDGYYWYSDRNCIVRVRLFGY